MNEVSPQTRSQSSSWRLTLAEFSGSFGDLGTFLPLAAAMTVVCGLDMGAVLVCAGAANVAAGLLLRQPIPVQPMKAIAAVAIVEGLAAGELIAAGLWMGVLLAFLAASGLIDVIARVVPVAVVRGIQLGVGAKLALLGVLWIADLEPGGCDGRFVAVTAMIALVLFVWRRLPAALMLFAAGLVILWVARPEAYAAVSLQLALPRLAWPEGGDWIGGLSSGAIPQLPLTVLNSVVAVCALSGDYFPGRAIGHRRMAATVAITNLAAVPLGGIPMCHGAGGLAALHRFGARTGGSVIMLGSAEIAVGLLFGGSLIGLMTAYPKAILGPLIILAGMELARAARKVSGTPNLVTALVCAAGILVANTFIGFVAGVATALVHGACAWLRVQWNSRRSYGIYNRGSVPETREVSR